MKNEDTPITNRIAGDLVYDEEGAGEICSADQVREMERIVNEMITMLAGVRSGRYVVKRWNDLFNS